MLFLSFVIFTSIQFNSIQLDRRGIPAKPLSAAGTRTYKEYDSMAMLSNTPPTGSVPTSKKIPGKKRDWRAKVQHGSICRVT